jgi:outer membrane protein OmpA-like peptidoglycan-associated protein
MKKFYILALLFSFVSLFAQTKLGKADELFKKYSYADAAKAYEECLRFKKRPSTQRLKNIGDSFYFISDNRNALRWYEKLYKKRGDKLSDAYFLRYIQTMKSESRFNSNTASLLTRARLDLKADQNELNRFLVQEKYLDSIVKTKSLYTIKNLDNNTALSDFGGTFYGGKIVFTSAKDSLRSINKPYNWNKQPFLNYYVAEINTKDGSLFSEKLLWPDVMTDYHQGTVAFSSDLKTIYYTTNVTKNNGLVKSKSNTTNFQIIKGTIENGKLIKSEEVSFASPEYSTGHPSLSEDGKLLFFASDMPGGYGETDLYVVAIDEDGKMGPPQNLGSTINTIGDDVFPFFINDILYFSSDGHYGLGRLDVYESRLTAGFNFSEPKNLGGVINSNKDDFSFKIDKSDSYGYFSSNRDYGKGDDDIYSFTKSGNQLISGKVVDGKSKVGIENVSVKVYYNLDDLVAETTTDSLGIYSVDFLPNQKVTIITSKINYNNDQKELETGNIRGKETKDVNFELIKQLISGKVVNARLKAAVENATVKIYNHSGDLVSETTTDSLGIYSVYVPYDERLKIIASKIKYSTEEAQVETDSNKAQGTILVDVELEEKIDINTIVFDSNTSTITYQASIELDRVVLIMQKRPTLRIRIESHSDAIGNDDYNMKLSERRAKATQSYIILKGIDASRIESAIGYGESRLINGCSNGIDCTKEEHFQNRRSNFFITKE